VTLPTAFFYQSFCGDAGNFLRSFPYFLEAPEYFIELRSPLIKGFQAGDKLPASRNSNAFASGRAPY